MESHLRDELIKYSRTDAYPFHMPGHKRNMGEDPFSSDYKIDITEIEGFDNLHKAEGILKEAEERAQNLYGSEETHFLVNGSTCGILSAISGSVKRKGKIIMAANCHKSAFHALLLNQLKCELIAPKINREYGIAGGIDPLDVKRMLLENPDAQAVFVTSPTYDGMISPIKEIAEVVHAHGIPLIVDEAHGAHFGFYEPFSKQYGMRSSITQGADIVIHSVHKTLPSYTQTALIHINGKLVDRERVRKYLAIYQTSSPSYLLMSGIDRCMGILLTDGKRLFAQWEENLREFYQIKDKLTHLRLPGDEVTGGSIVGRDVGKLLISSQNTTMTGTQIYDILRERFHLQLEMAAGDYCVAISTIMDTKEGFQRLKEALLEIDSMIQSVERPGIVPNYRHCEKIYEIYETEDRETEWVVWEDCKDRVAADFIYVYPPGIPLIVPGEKADESLISMVGAMILQGLNVTGIKEGKFKVLDVLEVLE